MVLTHTSLTSKPFRFLIKMLFAQVASSPASLNSLRPEAYQRGSGGLPVADKLHSPVASNSRILLTVNYKYQRESCNKLFVVKDILKKHFLFICYGCERSKRKVGLCLMLGESILWPQFLSTTAFLLATPIIVLLDTCSSSYGIVGLDNLSWMQLNFKYMESAVPGLREH